MSHTPHDTRASQRPLPAWLRWVHSGENTLVLVVLAGLVLIPLLEVVLRKLTKVGIAGSGPFVQHFTLLVGVLGGALAAREGRLLALSSLPNMLPGGWKPAALAVTTVLGAPLFATLGGTAMILFWGTGRPVSLIALEHYYLVTDPVLPSIPLFTLAGYFLAEGGASKRLVRVFRALVGSFRGGPGIVTALVCAFFTSFTGASGVTILALGGLLMRS